jgi:D-alanyl-D-alanine carboxypeptidase
MPLARGLPSHWVRIVGLIAALTIVSGSWNQSEARTRKEAKPRAVHGPSYRPNYADIVLDDTTGAVLHEIMSDEPRHPASLTKIMTLYLLFEQLEEGKLSLDTPLPVSAFAALQHPTKLGLKTNQSIKVEDAIKGLVTRSANDAAVVIAEAIAGTESDFAALMTLKARELGMTNTIYVNASGLPADEQITTARDQAILGCAIQHRFPVYYRYFATASFNYRGAEIRNHNMLLGTVKGVDGIKTGYTDASGYNLVSSVRRDGRHIVAVVLGGTSNAARDARMRQLIEEHITLAAVDPNAPVTVPAVAQDVARAAKFVPASAKSEPVPAGFEPRAARAKAPAAKAQVAVKPATEKSATEKSAANAPAQGDKPAAARPARATARASSVGAVQDAWSTIRPARQAERKPAVVTSP